MLQSFDVHAYVCQRRMAIGDQDKRLTTVVLDLVASYKSSRVLRAVRICSTCKYEGKNSAISANILKTVLPSTSYVYHIFLEIFAGNLNPPLT